MGWIGWIGCGVVACVLVFALWVRFAPSDPARWHRIPDGLEDGDRAGGAVRSVASGVEGLARLDEVILRTPRTERLAGSVDAGKVTYVTRSKLWRFPDYTTVQEDGRGIRIYGRARFGKSDLGVNAARIDGWLETLRQGG